MDGENDGRFRKTHGMAHTRLDNIYRTMVARCYKEYSKDYKNYGLRGINICHEWMDDKSSFFEWSLQNGYADNLTIDRKDNDGLYSPENCQWTTHAVQNRNTRANIRFTINGQSKILTDWAAEYGIKMGTVWRRMNREGWPLIDALTRPVDELRKRRDSRACS